MPKFLVERRSEQDQSVEVDAKDEVTARVIAKAIPFEDWTDNGGNVEYEVTEIEE